MGGRKGRFKRFKRFQGLGIAVPEHRGAVFLLRVMGYGLCENSGFCAWGSEFFSCGFFYRREAEKRAKEKMLRIIKGKGAEGFSLARKWLVYPLTLPLFKVSLQGTPGIQGLS